MTDLQEPAPPVVGNQWERRYGEVNATWPAEVPPLTGQEAISAARRLYRKAMGRALPAGKWTIASGNRRNKLWKRRVNPERGWHDLVHHVSHYCAQRLYPNAPPHGPGHSMLERDLIAHVVNSGWLDGKLRREPKAKPDAREERKARVLVRIGMWERKKRRAETALKKLYRTKAYYDRLK